ncbi:MAG: KTSC domain-containing protein [Anaeromicrobium sp.]|jgi:hypothetical protein|uniref:KTSC domain-containing protein n=1 Tax=Anaeromicrobium sp. TaxID=1929132 RepID=UPI0025F0F137|nr:KTSC domain-containing protein [Anaeromicrobium sp.]MCT4593572.1 KTSC domain-containing protein [Anaeromicrobium sp.]
MSFETPFTDNIKSIKYDLSEQILTIEFSDGEMYNHYGVPKYVYSDLTKAPIRGYFLHNRIRNNYPHKRVTGF